MLKNGRTREDTIALLSKYFKSHLLKKLPDFELDNLWIEYKMDSKLLENEITKEQFMQFFRDEEKLNQLSIDDRIEIFSGIMLGDGDFTKELLDRIFSDYGVTKIKIINN